MKLKDVEKRKDLVMVESSDTGFGMIRMVPIGNGDFLFHGKDCALVLEYKKTRNAIYKYVPESQIIRLKSKNFGRPKSGRPKLNNNGEYFITEEGLYRLIAGSKMPKAEEFRSWVFGELIPTFRKTGKYDMEDFAKSPHYKTIKNIPGFTENKLFKDRLKKETSDISRSKRILKSKVWNDFKRAFNEVYGVNLNLRITKMVKRFELKQRPTTREYLDYAKLHAKAYIIFEMLRYGDDIRQSAEKLAYVKAMCDMLYSELSEIEQKSVDVIIRHLYNNGAIVNLDDSDHTIKEAC